MYDVTEDLDFYSTTTALQRRGITAAQVLEEVRQRLSLVAATRLQAAQRRRYQRHVYLELRFRAVRLQAWSRRKRWRRHYESAQRGTLALASPRRPRRRTSHPVCRRTRRHLIDHRAPQPNAVARLNRRGRRLARPPPPSRHQRPRRPLHVR